MISQPAFCSVGISPSSRKRKYVAEPCQQQLTIRPRVEEPPAVVNNAIPTKLDEAYSVLLGLARRMEYLTAEVDQLRFQLPAGPLAFIATDSPAEPLSEGQIEETEKWLLNQEEMPDSRLTTLIEEVLTECQVTSKVITPPLFLKCTRRVFIELAHFEKYPSNPRLMHCLTMLARRLVYRTDQVDMLFDNMQTSIVQIFRSYRGRLLLQAKRFTIDFFKLPANEGRPNEVIAARPAPPPFYSQNTALPANYAWSCTQSVMACQRELLTRQVEEDSDEGSTSPTIWRACILPGVFGGTLPTLSDEAFVYAAVKFWLSGHPRLIENAACHLMAEYLDLARRGQLSQV